MSSTTHRLLRRSEEAVVVVVLLLAVRRVVLVCILVRCAIEPLPPIASNNMKKLVGRRANNDESLIQRSNGCKAPKRRPSFEKERIAKDLVKPFDPE